MMKKTDYCWYSSYEKPKQFKFIKRNTYSCLVDVYSSFGNSEYNKFLGKINLEYEVELSNGVRKIKDDISMKLEEEFGCKISVRTENFKRDGDFFPFIYSINIDKNCFKTYLRKEKLKNILENEK